MTDRRTDPATRVELFDTPDETALPGPLGYYLKLCHQELWPVFQREDREALAAQARYRKVSLTVAALGTAAVLAGCMELVFRSWERALIWIEGVLVVLAALAVLFGYWNKLHRSWLTSRCRAERLRLLKFASFADPRVWQDGARDEGWEAAFRREIEEIRAIEPDELDSISHHERVPAPVPEAAARAVPDATRRALTVYYRVKRLEPQIDYFQIRARKVRWLDNPVLLPFVFFFSLSIVLVHFAFTVVPGTVGETAGKGLLSASLAAPALFAGVRTYRSANEFARNRSRSIARESALRQISERLSGDPAPHGLFASVSMAEYILAADQHEWLRLMLDAEWYG